MQIEIAFQSTDFFSARRLLGTIPIAINTAFTRSELASPVGVEN
ncbi:MAG: hypothetical protein ACXAC8_18165 [Candidatus Hodarchaeales archaeon]